MNMDDSVDSMFKNQCHLKLPFILHVLNNENCFMLFFYKF